MKRYLVLCSLLALEGPAVDKLAAQDFILQGCYWDCPDDAASEIDPAAFNFWVSKVGEQAPALGYAGFTYAWLPSFYPGQQRQVASLVEALHRAGLETVLDIEYLEAIRPVDSVLLSPQPLYWLWDELKVRGFRLVSQRGLPPAALSSLLTQLEKNDKLPPLLMVRPPERRSADRLAGFINEVSVRLPDPVEAEADYRIFDYPLREALRRACGEKQYDVRTVFESSIRDLTALSGFKIVTIINNPEFYNPNGIDGDADDLIADPRLAYAYTLTNNQLGLPAVFYGDYFGSESEIEYFLDKAPLQEDIDPLIKVHREYIFNSTGVEYLNRRGAGLAGQYLSATEGAGPQRALLFQLDGNNTAAGQAAGGGRDVLVAINFADTTLRVIQEINPSNVNPGDRFTDLLGHAEQAATTVKDYPEYGLTNAVYIELPPRSYSVWVQGQAEKVLAGTMDFTVSPEKQYVELNWEVPSEKYIKGYAVERSINGERFQRLAWLDAIAKPGESAAYLFVDENIFPNETLHYRIKAVSGEQQFEYSAVEKVVIPEDDWRLEVLNEPGKVKNIQIRSSVNDQTQLFVYNADGELVLSKVQELRRGLNTTDIDLSTLPKGVYFIKLTTSRNKQWTQRIVHL